MIQSCTTACSFIISTKLNNNIDHPIIYIIHCAELHGISVILVLKNYDKKWEESNVVCIYVLPAFSQYRHFNVLGKRCWLPFCRLIPHLYVIRRDPVAEKIAASGLTQRLARIESRKGVGSGHSPDLCLIPDCVTAEDL